MAMQKTGRGAMQRQGTSRRGVSGPSEGRGRGSRRRGTPAVALLDGAKQAAAGSCGRSRGRRRGSLAGLLRVAGEVQVRQALDNGDMADEEAGDRLEMAVLSVNGQTSGVLGARTHDAEVVTVGLRWCGA